MPVKKETYFTTVQKIELSTKKNKKKNFREKQ